MQTNVVHTTLIDYSMTHEQNNPNNINFILITSLEFYQITRYLNIWCWISLFFLYLFHHSVIFFKYRKLFMKHFFFFSSMRNKSKNRRGKKCENFANNLKMKKLLIVVRNLNELRVMMMMISSVNKSLRYGWHDIFFFIFIYFLFISQKRLSSEKFHTFVHSQGHY